MEAAGAGTGLSAAEEAHLQQLAGASSSKEEEAARQAVQSDLEERFQSAGQQMEGERCPPAAADAG